MDLLSATALYTASTWVVPVLLAITLHEAAHGFVAHRLGDHTAWLLGRVSFNPFKHIDPFGTIVLPALLLFLHAPFLFGYAKPVPVKFSALRNPRHDMVLVAGAGPATNLLQAFAAALLIHIVGLLPDELLLTRDQVELLKSDNVVSSTAVAEQRTLPGLGIVPTSVEAIVPSYLWRFRKSGQFDTTKSG